MAEKSRIFTYKYDENEDPQDEGGKEDLYL
jgi:hypothetical protein